MPHFRHALALSAVFAIATPVLAQFAPDQPGRVAVAMKSYAFTPATLAFRAGQSYQLALTNTAGGGHSFSAPEFFKAVTVAPEDQSKIKNGEVEVEGHTTVEIRITPRVPGHYKFKCTHFLHASFGMTGTIDVE